MPPTSNTRKSSTATMTMTEPHHAFYNPSMVSHPTATMISASNTALAQPRRSTSGRAIRVNTTRPANYYARPYGPLSASAGGGYGDTLDSAGSGVGGGHGGNPLAAAGFFPALQYFSDAITALPKEVMRQFTLMKEVEAKIHGPGEKLGDLLDGLLDLPVPSRQESAMLATLRGSVGTGPGTHGLITAGSTAENSVTGSANQSLVNGVAGGQRSSMQFSAAGSVHSEDLGESEVERARRTQYHELRMMVHGLLANLDEKNVVLAEANRVLTLQERRIDSVMPHVDGEIHEEARLGSMTHWAYSDNRQKKQSAGQAAASRRDLAATNNLAAAAAIAHENDIAQARREAGREAIREKTKGKRLEPPGDSDFDDKPKRGRKGVNGKAATSAPTAGLGISTNGEPAAKRKKTEKAAAAAAAVGMERTVSSASRGMKAAKETPRSTPAAEVGVRKAPKTKPAPPIPKKKPPTPAQASPMLASSPLVSSFNPANVVEPPPPPPPPPPASGVRPQSTRLRQNSNATNPRVDKVAGEESSSSRPASAAGKANGNVEKVNGKRKAPEPIEIPRETIVDEVTTRQLKEASEQLKREDIEMRDAEMEARPVPSRSGSSSLKNSGRGSKVGTPRNESFADRDVPMSRTRSTRSRPGTKNGESRDSSSSEPQSAAPSISKHRRIASNSNLVKQLAPFNRSPDLDRHRSRDDMDDDLESLDGKIHVVDPPAVIDEPVASPIPTIPEAERETRRTSVRRPPRNSISERWRSGAGPEESTPEPTPPATVPSTRARQPTSVTVSDEPVASPALSSVTLAKPGGDERAEPHEDDEEEDSEHDPDDPNEPKYCYCNRGSYGEMVACDNDACSKEWFHLGCTELRKAPGEEEKWYCRDCRPKFMRKGRGGRGVIGRA